eukprot:m.281152 g.281152  ORF g.281152 m.281152 type:complete len:496 (-) comp16330_c0_seq2:2018-3505(-)
MASGALNLPRKGATNHAAVVLGMGGVALLLGIRSGLSFTLAIIIIIVGASITALLSSKKKVLRSKKLNVGRFDDARMNNDGPLGIANDNTQINKRLLFNSPSVSTLGYKGNGLNASGFSVSGFNATPNRRGTIGLSRRNGNPTPIGRPQGGNSQMDNRYQMMESSAPGRLGNLAKGFSNDGKRDEGLGHPLRNSKSSFDDHTPRPVEIKKGNLPRPIERIAELPFSEDLGIRTSTPKHDIPQKGDDVSAMDAQSEHSMAVVRSNKRPAEGEAASKKRQHKSSKGNRASEKRKAKVGIEVKKKKHRATKQTDSKEKRAVSQAVKRSLSGSEAADELARCLREEKRKVEFLERQLTNSEESLIKVRKAISEEQETQGSAIVPVVKTSKKQDGLLPPDWCWKGAAVVVTKTGQAAEIISVHPPLPDDQDTFVTIRMEKGRHRELSCKDLRARREGDPEVPPRLPPAELKKSLQQTVDSPVLNRSQTEIDRESIWTLDK